MIYRILGCLLFIEATFMVLCTLMSVYYQEDDLSAFIFSTLITTGAGIPLVYAGKEPSVSSAGATDISL